MSHPLSRRDLLRSGAAAAVSLAAPALARPVAHGAPLPLLPDLPLVREGGIARGQLSAEPTEIEIGERRIALLGYDGRVPGPVIRLRHDETLALDFRNGLDEATNLHTHGLSVTPQGDGDNPFRQIAPGTRAPYHLPLRGDPLNGGLHWYHPHLHGRQSAQLFAGLAGPMVVDGPEDPGPLLGPHDEQILVLKDLRLAGEEVAQARGTDWLMGLEGEVTLVNGAVRPQLSARERRIRLRLVNASNARHWRLVARGGATRFAVIALDGRTIAAPTVRSELLLAPAQRVDAVLDLEPGTPAELVDLGVARRGSFPRRPETILTIRPPAGGAPPTPLPTTLIERTPFAEARAAERREVVFSLFYINGRLHREHEPLFRPRSGTSEIWELRNVDTMDHPFHLHTWPFRLLEEEGHAIAGQPYRDTLHLRSGGSARIGIEFGSLAGRSVFHCHIVEHADKGMMAVLEVTE